MEAEEIEVEEVEVEEDETHFYKKTINTKIFYNLIIFSIKYIFLDKFCEDTNY